jgi:DNA processing protein
MEKFLKRVDMKFKIWLILLNVSDNIKIKSLEKFKSEKNIYDNFHNLAMEEVSILKNLQTYNKKLELEKAEDILRWMNDNKVGLITIGDEEYPESLKVIQNPPYGLFYKGKIELVKDKIVAIVGSRTCTTYGTQVTKLLTKELISYNITIISGGAKGIDSVAHNAVIEDNGNTIVVLGCGIDVVYPMQNKCLFREIEKRGLIISEFLPKTPPLSFNFPRRNRIISGLSELVLVVEASEKSGSLITANYAIEQNKEVMVVPGSIFSKGSIGCNKLIRDGAQIFCSMEDLYLLLKLENTKNIKILSPIKEKILKIVSDGPTHIDEIVNKAYVGREALFNVLFEMQNKNEIISLPGNYYAKII